MQSELDRLLEELDRELGQLKGNHPELFMTCEERRNIAIEALIKDWQAIGVSVSEALAGFVANLQHTPLWSLLGLDLSDTARRRGVLYDKLYPDSLENKLKRWSTIDDIYGRFANWLSDKWPERFLPGDAHE